MTPCSHDNALKQVSGETSHEQGQPGGHIEDVGLGEDFRLLQVRPQI